MAKKINYQVLFKNSSYSSTELASILKISRHTVHYWVHNCGLKPINPTEHGWIFDGEALKKFLKEKLRRFKVKIKDGEMYCLSCRFGKKINENSIELKYTGKKIGLQEAVQIIIHGLCVTCGNKCRRLSSSNRIDEFLRHYPNYLK